MKLLAALAVLAAIWWLWQRRTRPATSLDEARDLLGLPPGADAEAIVAAHRRIMTRVHPDAGGSEGLARRANAARDTLIAATRRPDRH